MTLSQWRARRKRREFWLSLMAVGWLGVALMAFALQVAPLVRRLVP